MSASKIILSLFPNASAPFLMVFAFAAGVLVMKYTTPADTPAAACEVVVSELIHDGCVADPWSAGLYCHWHDQRGGWVRTRSY